MLAGPRRAGRVLLLPASMMLAPSSVLLSTPPPRKHNQPHTHKRFDVGTKVSYPPSGSSSGSGGRNSRLVPVKDREPFPNILSGRTNIAVLVDADFVAPLEFDAVIRGHAPTALAAAAAAAAVASGQPQLTTAVAMRGVGWKSSRAPPNWALQRVFAVEESPDWTAFRASRQQCELFTVDSFIPPHIQILADVAHIMDHRKANGADGVLLVVADAHHEPYVKAFSDESENGGWCWVVASPDGTVTAGEVALPGGPTSSAPRDGG